MIIITIFVAVSYTGALCYVAFNFDRAAFPIAETKTTIMHPLVESCSSLPLLPQPDMSTANVQLAFLETSCSHSTPAALPEFAKASPRNQVGHPCKEEQIADCVSPFSLTGEEKPYLREAKEEEETEDRKEGPVEGIEKQGALHPG